MTIQKIKEAVADLPANERAEFATWFEQYRAQEFDEWDRQMQRDAEAGKFDKLIKDRVLINLVILAQA